MWSGGNFYLKMAFDRQKFGQNLAFIALFSSGNVVICQLKSSLHLRRLDFVFSSFALPHLYSTGDANRKRFAKKEPFGTKH